MRVALAFSGGKDSLLLYCMLRESGIQFDLLHARTRGCDWSCHVTYVDEFRPIVFQTHHDIAWIVENPEMLFPKCSKLRNRWFAAVQRRGVNSLALRGKYDVVLWGRRHQENTVKAKRYKLNGYDVCHPIAELKTPEVWSRLAQYGIDRSPLYDLPDSSRRGVHRWVTRQDDPPWSVIRKYEPSIFEEACRCGLA